MADFCRLSRPRSSRPISSSPINGKANAISIMRLPPRSARSWRARPSVLLRMAALLVDLALGRAHHAGRGGGRQDARPIDQTGGIAAGDPVVVVRRELDVAADP